MIMYSLELEEMYITCYLDLRKLLHGWPLFPQLDTADPHWLVSVKKSTGWK
jgi:hypothetical protein